MSQLIGCFICVESDSDIEFKLVLIGRTINQTDINKANDKDRTSQMSSVILSYVKDYDVLKSWVDKFANKLG